MSVIDILTRVDSICKKYDKYDIDKQKDSNISGDDAFARLYAVVEADIEAALEVILAFIVTCCFLENKVQLEQVNLCSHFLKIFSSEPI